MEKDNKTLKEKKKKQTKKEQKSLVKRILGFFVGVRSEVLRIRWPNRKTLFKYSFATICFVIFFALFFFAIEVVFAFFKTLV